MKGYRTYISLACAAIANVLPLVVEVSPEVDKALVVLFLALAAYFRKKA